MGATHPKPVDELANEIVELTKKKMIADYPDPKATRRDAHPKTLGLVKAEFTVIDDLPADLRVGVFATAGKTYPCWVRFSNADLKANSDIEPDNRGCAIKLMSDEEEEKSLDQDFVLMNSTVNPLGTPEVFRDLTEYIQVSAAALFTMFLLKGHLPRLLKLMNGRSVCESVLGESYHSTTPYAFGTPSSPPVKYALFPTNYNGPALPDKVGENYLTVELQSRLEKQDATFDFCVQFRRVDSEMPMDDAGVEWPAKLSPFVKVATLRIPQQSFTAPERFEQAERMQFNVGHSWPEHKPLGRLNEVRIKVYKALSEFRLTRSSRHT